MCTYNSSTITHSSASASHSHAPAASLSSNLPVCVCVCVCLKVADRLLTCDDISLGPFVEPLKLCLSFANALLAGNWELGKHHQVRRGNGEPNEGKQTCSAHCKLLIL